MKKVIVIFGNAGHGKDTLTEMILNHSDVHPDPEVYATHLSFAEPVKRIAMALVGMPREIAFGGQKDRLSWNAYGKNAREWLQWIGTELGREMIDKNLWVKRLAQEVLACSFAPISIVSDGRFENEFDLQKHLLDNKGNKLAEVINVIIRRPGIPVNTSHPSESIVANMDDDRFHIVVDNSGTLGDLSFKAADILKLVTEGLVPVANFFKITI